MKLDDGSCLLDVAAVSTSCFNVTPLHWLGSHFLFNISSASSLSPFIPSSLPQTFQTVPPLCHLTSETLPTCLFAFMSSSFAKNPNHRALERCVGS